MHKWSTASLRTYLEPPLAPLHINITINFLRRERMDLDELVEEISLLMKEFLLDTEEGRDPPKSLCEEIEFKLYALAIEREMNIGH